MDCVRVSTKEVQGRKYLGDDYMQFTPPNGVRECRQTCVTKKDCESWFFTSDGECHLNKNLQSRDSVRSVDTGVQSGLVVCKDDWSMLQLIWWIVILGVIFFAVWYVLNVCVPRARSRGDRFLPSFSFE